MEIVSLGGFGWPRSRCIGKVDLELTTILPMLSKILLVTHNEFTPRWAAFRTVIIFTAMLFCSFVCLFRCVVQAVLELKRFTCCCLPKCWD